MTDVFPSPLAPPISPDADTGTAVDAEAACDRTVDGAADAASDVAVDGASAGQPGETAIAAAAIAWFDSHARDLPWRHPETGAWGVLVSEIMLQQTPVNRVLPVYEAWLQRWPTPAALAADDPAEAIRAWGRLGYPRRAMRLHECAIAIVERHDGVVPAEVELLAKLPGIGTYTAHAVATFAYGRRHPVVDTNVRRFIARVVEGAAEGGPATTSADLRATELLLPPVPARAARASAAFMELGALICVARTPRCGECPLLSDCAWRAAGYPPAAGPARRPQTYAGTDRQIRGRLLAILRDSTEPVPARALDTAWPDEGRRLGALVTLLDDGLAVEVSPGYFAVGGTKPGSP